MEKISFIIVNYNTKKITAECINSIILNQSLENFRFEIIIVDNNSSDGSVIYLSNTFKEYSNIKVISSQVNLGFGRANNHGASKSKGEILIFLNSDTIVSFTDFPILIDSLKENVGFLSSKILNSDGSVQSLGFKYPGVINDFKLSFLFWNFNFIKRLRLRNYKEVGLKKVDWVSGCFMICKKCDFIEINGFDPKIFMYAEDIDICKKMDKIGKINLIYDRTSIYHLQGKSDSNKKDMLQKLLKNKKNYYYVMKKHEMGNIKMIKFMSTIHIFILIALKKINYLYSRINIITKKSI